MKKIVNLIKKPITWIISLVTFVITGVSVLVIKSKGKHFRHPKH